MSNELTDLKCFVQDVLQERAMTAASATRENLALFVYKPSENKRAYVLFDRNAFVHSLIKAVRILTRRSRSLIDTSPTAKKVLMRAKRDKSIKYWILNFMVENSSKFLRATTDVARHWHSRNNMSNGAWQVHGPAAVGKYGPLIYDIAMADVGELMPDRGDVSGTAQKVWKFYKDNRSDVVSTPLDDKHDPITPQKSDDSSVHNSGEENFGNFLDSSYHHRGSGPNVEEMKRSYEQLSTYLVKTLGISSGLLKMMLINAADNFYSDMYSEKNF